MNHNYFTSAKSQQLMQAYGILGVDPESNLYNIREKFKKLVLLHHPDKGGNPIIFDSIKNAYTLIYNEKQDEIKLNKRQNMTYDEYNKQRNYDINIPNYHGGGGYTINHGGGGSTIPSTNSINSTNNGINPSVSSSGGTNVPMDPNSFNRVFEQHKQYDVYQEDRLEFLKSDPSKSKLMQIARIYEPVSFDNSILCNMRNTNENEPVNDYSTWVNKARNKRDASCFDIKYAYENKPILENNMPNCREFGYLS